MIGSSQWEPAVNNDPLTEPDSEWFCSQFQRTFGQRSRYPAAKAYAVGVTGWTP